MLKLWKYRKKRGDFMPIPTYEPYLKEGITDPRVGELQTALNQANVGTAGYQPLQVDTIFGPKTANALRQFQSAQNIGVDAIYGPESAGALQNVLAQQTPGTPGQITGTAGQGTVKVQPEKLAGGPGARADVFRPGTAQPEAFQSPYEQRFEDLLTRMEERYAQGFQYDPTQDVELQQAQTQAQQSVMERMNQRGIFL